jgi:hypothetical protein
MTEDDLYACSAGRRAGLSVCGAAWQRRFPAVAAPYIIFSIPTDVAGDVFCGQAESTLHIQVDVWAETNDEARALRLRPFPGWKCFHLSR